MSIRFVKIVSIEAFYAVRACCHVRDFDAIFKVVIVDGDASGAVPVVIFRTALRVVLVFPSHSTSTTGDNVEVAVETRTEFVLFLLAAVISNLSITCFADRAFSSSVLQAILNRNFLAIISFCRIIIVSVLRTAVAGGEVGVHGRITGNACIS